MQQTVDRPQFTVTIGSRFISSFQWAVHAIVEFRDLSAVENRNELVSEAQLELMLGIARECQIGRIRGARSVVVLVEGDREVAGLFRGGPLPLDAPRVA